MSEIYPYGYHESPPLLTRTRRRLTGKCINCGREKNIWIVHNKLAACCICKMVARYHSKVIRVEYYTTETIQNDSHTPPEHITHTIALWPDGRFLTARRSLTKAKAPVRPARHWLD